MSAAGTAAHTADSKLTAAVAAAGVAGAVLFHAGAAGFGGAGPAVDVFLAAIGFWWARHLVRRPTDTDTVVLWREAARLLAPGVLVLVLWSLVHGALLEPAATTRTWADRRDEALAALGFVSNFWVASSGARATPLVHLWPIAIAAQWVLVAPWVRRTLSLDHTLAAIGFATVAAVSAAVAAGVDAAGNSADALLVTPLHLYPLLAGAAAGCVIVSPLRSYALPVAIAGAGAVVLACTGSGVFLPLHGPLATVGACAVLLGAAASRPVHGVQRLDGPEWLLAAVVAAYLWHWPVLLALTPARTDLDGTPLLVLRLAVTTLAAVAQVAAIDRVVVSGVLRRRPGPLLAALAAASVLTLVLVSTR